MTERPDWVFERPAPTIVGTRRSSEGIIVGRQLAGDDRRDNGGHSGAVGLGKHQLAGVRVTAEEAAILQSYPTHFLGAGRTAQQTAQQRPRSVDSPAHTITGMGTAAFLGDEPRQATMEESATLQSFPNHIQKADTVSHLVALDLFAGTGWGVACDWLGIEENGVDIMPEVVATREANGMKTIFQDVWDGLLPYNKVWERTEDPDIAAALKDWLLAGGTKQEFYNLLIASPPCQTFSQAGSGAGRKALDLVLASVRNGDYKVPPVLQGLGNATDPRTALVLTPLAYAYRDRPEYIIFEQVPPVLPVWEACADVLRELGYSAWTGILNSEQYGVPQTRKRAILIARRDGVEATPPVPTHSKYYNRDPKRLDEGVKKWVSMAEALGWGTTEKPSYTVTGGGRETGGYEPFPTGARAGMQKAVEEGEWALRSNYGTNGDPAKRGERSIDEPAATITSKADRNFFIDKGVDSLVQERHRGAGMLERHGDRKARPVTDPALTITGNASGTTPGGFRVREDDDQWKWKDTPATTIAGDPRITAREHHYHGEQNSTSFRLELPEAEALQSYPPMQWKGTKGKVFLMIGNAVPPVLARAILETLLP